VKAEIVSRVAEWNRLFVGRRFRILNRLDSEWVQACCRQSVVNDPDQVLATYDNGFEVTRALICQFNISRHVTKPLFNACIRLYRARETAVEEAYEQSNRIIRPNRYFLADLDFMEKLLENDINGAVASIQNPNDFKKFLFPVLCGLRYRLLIVSTIEKSISIFDPYLNCSMPPEHTLSEKLHEDIQEYAHVIMVFLRATGLHDDENEMTWLSPSPAYIFPTYKELVQYYEPVTTDADSAIYVLTAIDFICNDVPCIFFVNNIPHLRVLFAHQVLLQKFPI
jgi:hypothetical protein